MATVTQSIASRACHTLTVAQSVTTRITNSYVTQSVTSRANHALTVAQSVTTRIGTPSASTLLNLQQELSSDAVPSIHLGSRILIRNLAGGTSKQINGNLCSSITYTRGRNEPATWSVTIPDGHDRDFSPLNTASDYYSWIKPDVYNSEWNLNRPWYIQCKVGDDTWTSPPLVLLDVQRSASEQGYVTTFSGTDYSRNLCQENQTLASKESDSSTIYYAKDIIAYILEAYNYDHYDLSGMEDFPVRIMHFQGGSPMDWLMEILEVPKADWRWEGQQFVVEQVNRDGAGQDWEYQDRFNVFSANYRYNTSGLINEVEVVRTESGAGEEVHEGTDVGIITITLNSPRYGPHLRLPTPPTFGTIENVTFLNAAGALAPGPYTTCRFTFRQDEAHFTEVGSHATGTCYWKVAISGWTIEEMNAASLPFDDDYNVRVKNTTNQALYGKWPAPSPIMNPLIPSEDWAITHGQRYLEEEIRKLETMDFTVPLNPWLRPGNIVRVTEYGSNQSGRKYLVESITHDLGTGQTQFLGARYQ